MSERLARLRDEQPRTTSAHGKATSRRRGRERATRAAGAHNLAERARRKPPSTKSAPRAETQRREAPDGGTGAPRGARRPRCAARAARHLGRALASTDPTAASIYLTLMGSASGAKGAAAAPRVLAEAQIGLRQLVSVGDLSSAPLPLYGPDRAAGALGTLTVSLKGARECVQAVAPGAVDAAAPPPPPPATKPPAAIAPKPRAAPPTEEEKAEEAAAATAAWPKVLRSDQLPLRLALRLEGLKVQPTIGADKTIQRLSVEVDLVDLHGASAPAAALPEGYTLAADGSAAVEAPARIVSRSVVRTARKPKPRFADQPTVEFAHRPEPVAIYDGSFANAALGAARRAAAKFEEAAAAGAAAAPAAAPVKAPPAVRGAAVRVRLVSSGRSGVHTIGVTDVAVSSLLSGSSGGGGGERRLVQLLQTEADGLKVTTAEPRPPARPPARRTPLLLPLLSSPQPNAEVCPLHSPRHPFPFPDPNPSPSPALQVACAELEIAARLMPLRRVGFGALPPPQLADDPQLNAEVHAAAFHVRHCANALLRTRPPAHAVFVRLRLPGTPHVDSSHVALSEVLPENIMSAYTAQQGGGADARATFEAAVAPPAPKVAPPVYRNTSQGGGSTPRVVAPPPPPPRADPEGTWSKEVPLATLACAELLGGARDAFDAILAAVTEDGSRTRPPSAAHPLQVEMLAVGRKGAAVVATHSLDLAELLGPGGGGGDLAAAPVDLKDTSGFPLCRVTLSVGAQRAARALSMPTERATAAGAPGAAVAVGAGEATLLHETLRAAKVTRCWLEVDLRRSCGQLTAPEPTLGRARAR